MGANHPLNKTGIFFLRGNIICGSEKRVVFWNAFSVFLKWFRATDNQSKHFPLRKALLWVNFILAYYLMKRMGKCYKLNCFLLSYCLKTTNHGIFKNVLFELEDLYHLSLHPLWQLPPLASSLLLCLFPRGVHLSCRGKECLKEMLPLA